MWWQFRCTLNLPLLLRWPRSVTITLCYSFCYGIVCPAGGCMLTSWAHTHGEDNNVLVCSNAWEWMSPSMCTQNCLFVCVGACGIMLLLCRQHIVIHTSVQHIHRCLAIGMDTAIKTKPSGLLMCSPRCCHCNYVNASPSLLLWLSLLAHISMPPSPLPLPPMPTSIWRCCWRLSGIRCCIGSCRGNV